jgi:hypothetical protein
MLRRELCRRGDNGPDLPRDAHTDAKRHPDAKRHLDVKRHHRVRRHP